MSSTSSTSTSSAADARRLRRRRLDEAAVHATELVQTFATVDDPYSTADDNPWKHPAQIFQKLKAARDDLLEAWKDLEKQQQEEEERQQENSAGDEKKSPAVVLDPERCRALYMDMITDAFADTLENMRNNSTNASASAEEGGTTTIDVDVLVDCLQSGMDLLTTEEQEALLFSHALDHEFDGEEDDDGDNNMNAEHEDEEEKLTPHELNRRKMGLDVDVSSG